MNESSFMVAFFVAFAGVFDIFMNTELNFPEPIGMITPFDITAFFTIASILADMVNLISSRGGDS